MCTTNHPGMARPGYLIDAPMESIASVGAVFTRMLAHHREIGLNCEQVMALLDLNREYHSRQVAIQLEFAQISESLEIKWGRINDQEIAKRENLLKRHAQLFEEHERLFFEMARRGHEILTDEQLERAEAVYHEEKEEMLRTLAPSLNRAVGPRFSFAETSGLRTNGKNHLESLQSAEPVFTA